MGSIAQWSFKPHQFLTQGSHSGCNGTRKIFKRRLVMSANSTWLYRWADLEFRANCECSFSLTTLQRRTCWLPSREQAANQSHSLIWLSPGILIVRWPNGSKPPRTSLPPTLWATTFYTLNRRQLEQDHHGQGMLSPTHRLFQNP